MPIEFRGRNGRVIGEYCICRDGVVMERLFIKKGAYQIRSFTDWAVVYNTNSN